VLDVADRLAPKQLETVRSVLDEIGATTQPRILLLNKVDRYRTFERDQREACKSPEEWLRDEPDALFVSAKTGEGLEELERRALAHLLGEVRECEVSVPLNAGKVVDFIEKRLHVIERSYDVDRVTFKARLGRRQAEQLASAPGLLLDGMRAGEAIASLFAPPVVVAPRRIPPHERT